MHGKIGHVAAAPGPITYHRGARPLVCPSRSAQPLACASHNAWPRHAVAAASARTPIACPSRSARGPENELNLYNPNIH